MHGYIVDLKPVWALRDGGGKGWEGGLNIILQTSVAALALLDPSQPPASLLGKPGGQA